MDGPLIATIISSSVVVGGAIAGSYWRLMGRIGNQDKSIAELGGHIQGLDGKIDGLHIASQSFQDQFGDLSKRFDRMDRRINGTVDKTD